MCRLLFLLLGVAGPLYLFSLVSMDFYYFYFFEKKKKKKKRKIFLQLELFYYICYHLFMLVNFLSHFRLIISEMVTFCDGWLSG